MLRASNHCALCPCGSDPRRGSDTGRSPQAGSQPHYGKLYLRYTPRLDPAAHRLGEYAKLVLVDTYFACSCGVCGTPRKDELDARADWAAHLLATLELVSA